MLNKIHLGTAWYIYVIKIVLYMTQTCGRCRRFSFRKFEHIIVMTFLNRTTHKING